MKRQIILGVVLSTSLLFAFPALSVHAEWMKNQNGWCYSEQGSYCTGWKFINNEWYYFDENGYMKTGWLYSNNKWYFLYNNGMMASNTTIDGYLLGADGSWAGTSSNNQCVLSTDQDSYNLGVSKINYHVINNINSDLSYAENYTVEKLQDNKWLPLETNEVFENTAIEVSMYSKSTEVCDLSYLKDYKNLTAGTYRIVKSVYVNTTGEQSTIYAQFELK